MASRTLAQRLSFAAILAEDLTAENEADCREARQVATALRSLCRDIDDTSRHISQTFHETDHLLKQVLAQLEATAFLRDRMQQLVAQYDAHGRVFADLRRELRAARDDVARLDQRR